MNDYLVSWRPQVIASVGLMLLGWVLLYVLVSQGARALMPKTTASTGSGAAPAASYGGFDLADYGG